jgi:hypothetical protein
MAIEGCEYLSIGGISSHAFAVLTAMQAESRAPGQFTARYAGDHDLLMLWGLGRAEHAQAWRQHAAKGRLVVMWDLGYFGRGKRGGYYRMSVNAWHPQELLDRTAADPSRWEVHGIELRDDFDPDGPILLIGMGPKSHQFTGEFDWEARKLADLRARFPDRRILYRPKPGKPVARINCDVDTSSSIDLAMRGAALVVCRHSNAGVDATVAGVPFECEDGAAKWLEGKPFTAETRLDFLRRLAWWQWKPSEAAQTWQFLRKVIR